ncbi:microsomal glutathione S-transferase 1-like isoform X1 [Biomphalaria glabrata]|uniref:Microsomal glutathione S-transferase 1 n=2 Tax=Biomphalaria glabrata TaxID=6526 RepID=A0A9W3BED1_BIOGL|nr:microsomal glutathione S-transferase 1-like isoform X1 [Biomphalaria glabrata]
MSKFKRCSLSLYLYTGQRSLTKIQKDLKMVTATLTLDNPVFRTFIGYAALVLLKTCLMSIFTSIHRMKRKVFINEEDAKSLGGKIDVKISTHPYVERIRRCHLNDLENVLPFVLLGLLYVAIGPSQGIAILHFRIFTISRFLHTFVYLGAVPQPARALCFLVGFLVNISMAINVILVSTF